MSQQRWGKQSNKDQKLLDLIHKLPHSLQTSIMIVFILL